jgi:glycosyltransferase involved in cell wall biosynthesis
MRRIFFVNRFFAPDHSATSQLVSDVGAHLASIGHEVHAVTSQQLYDQPETRLPAYEVRDGIHIHRVAATQFGRKNLVGRAFDYSSFYVSAWRALNTLLNRDDILVAMTDPPLISIPAMMAARRRKAGLINWLQDVYPEVAVKLGVPGIKGPLFWSLALLRNRSLTAAMANVVLGERMADKISSLVHADQPTCVIWNWCNDTEISPIARHDNPLRRQWSLEDKFVVGYSGNLGRAHEYETVLAAAERLKTNPEILFLFIGGGHGFQQLAKRVHERGLKNFRFMDYQPSEMLKFSLSVPDVHWVSLLPQVEGLIVPSKVYGIAAAGRPIITIGSKDGEIARVVRKFECGGLIEIGDDPSLADMILQLAADSELRATMGQRARAMLESQFTRRQALDRWRALIERMPR